MHRGPPRYTRTATIFSIRKLGGSDHPKVPVEAALLGHVAPRPSVVVGGGPAAPLHRPGVGLEHAEEHPHQRRLAGAVGAEEAHHPAGRHLSVDPVEHDPIAEALMDSTPPQGVGHRSSRARPAPPSPTAPPTPPTRPPP